MSYTENGAEHAPDQNNYSEAEAAIKIDPTIIGQKSVDPRKQHDSEGMCIEE